MVNVTVLPCFPRYHFESRIQNAEQSFKVVLHQIFMKIQKFLKHQKKLKTLHSTAEFNADFKSALIFATPFILCEI